METLVVTIKKKNKAAFTKELLKSFDFLEVAEEKKSAFTKNPIRKKALIKALKEVKLAEEGKLKLKNWDEVVKKLK